MEQVVFKIGEVSARLGLIDKNNNTLRGWSEEFSAFLSAAANPEPGVPRRFSARDVQVLTAVRDYRANHLSYDEIRERLRAGELDVASASPGDDAPRFGQATPVGDGQALMPLAQVERLLAPLAASVEEWRRLADEYRTRLEAREARIEALEQRLEDLYGRLNAPTARQDTQDTHNGVASDADTRDDAPHTEPPVVALEIGSAAAVPPAPGAAMALPENSSNGHAPASLDPAIFPLAVVERAVSHNGAAPTLSARRPWWRVWR